MKLRTRATHRAAVICLYPDRSAELGMSPRTLLVSLASCLLIGCASSKPTHELRVIRSPSGAVAVPVELDDYAIRMPDPIPSGAVTFDVKNLGDHTHTIRVTGNGVDERLAPNLKSGAHGALAMHLAPGAYKVTCPVGPHAMMGMSRKLTVER